MSTGRFSILRAAPLIRVARMSRERMMAFALLTAMMIISAGSRSMATLPIAGSLHRGSVSDSVSQVFPEPSPVYDGNLRHDISLNGTIVSAGGKTWKSTVLLHNGQARCSGTLIGPHLVVTAAHCALDEEAEIYVFGLLKNQDVIILDVVPGSNFVPYRRKPPGDKLFTGDIAVVFLSKPVQSPFHPVSLHTDLQALEPGKKVLQAGFGIHDLQGNIDTQLRFLRGTVTESTKHGAMRRVNYGDTKAVCTGDSGGPVFIEVGDRLLLVAVINGTEVTVEKKCFYGAGGLVVPVAHFAAWLSHRTEEAPRYLK